MSRGRPQKPHHPSWGGDPIPGLYKCHDGRWRINATGQKFTEADERRAVHRFLEWKAKNQPEAVVHLTMDLKEDDPAPIAPVGVWDENVVTMEQARMGAAIAEHARRDLGFEPASEINAAYPVPEAVVWPWVRTQFFNRPEYVARMLGVSEAAVRNLPLAKPSLKLDALIDVYREQNPSTDKAKKRCVDIFRRLMEHAGAKTLDDLTTEKLIAFRQHVETSTDITSGGTKRWMYGQIKSLIAFGLKVGLDPVQLEAALTRCKVLWTCAPPPDLNPKPISRADFHALLKVAGDGP